MTSFKTRNNFSRLWKAQPEAPLAFPPKASTRFPPRSNTYLITGLQNELTKSGILKNMADHEDFWKLVQEEALGVGIKEKLQKIRFKLMNPRPWPPAAETRRLASTDQDRGGCQGTQSLLSRLTEWRKQCQQHAVAPKLPHEQGESKIVSKTRTDSPSKRYLSRLNQMHSASLANMEFSRRLLERDGRFADLLAEHRARSLLDYMVPSRHMQADAPPGEMGVEDPPVPGQQLQTPPALRFLKSHSPESLQRSSRLKTGRQHVTLCDMKGPVLVSAPLELMQRSSLNAVCKRVSSLSYRSKLSDHVRGKLAPAGITTDPRPTAPLTLEHVIQTHPVVEAKTARRYWVNYVDEE